MENLINVKNAKENNLKDITVSIPKECICGICGVSGSGKSTLACDVIAKYALKAFALSMPIKLRNKLLDRKTPDVNSIDNLPPVILVDIKNANRSIRSTVATTSGLMTILRNMFSLCAKNNKSTKNRCRVYPRLFSYNILESNGGGACSCCGGTGSANRIYAESIIVDEKKSLLSGAISVVNEKGIKYTKITDLFIKAFCKAYDIDINKSLKDYSKKELDMILYGTDKIIKFTDRSGGNGGKKELPFPGVIGSLLEVYNRTKNANLEKYIMDGTCSVCNGSRYNEHALDYKIDDYSISDFLEMNITEAKDTIFRLSKIYGTEFEGFAEEFSLIAQELETIGVGYLGLDRPISTLSGGELQRIKLAKQIAMKYEGYCYIIDEPSTGLHDINVIELMNSINRLKENHNTVLLIEHNPLILNACDYLIELGVGGGNKGGNIVAIGTPKEIISKETLTGMMLKKHLIVSQPVVNIETNKLGIYGVSVNNLKNVDIEIPLNSFIAVAGVSGSGKSSAINNALYSTIDTYLKTGKKKNSLKIDAKIEGIVRLDQNASVTNSRSNVGTLLGILEKIRTLFTNLNQSKDMGFDASAFSKNSKKGACPLCGGTGVLLDEDKSEEICDECNGTGYRSEILNIKYKGYSIAEILALTVDELINIFDDGYINRILIACQEIGLGYLSLDRKSPSLSKGEYQRIRIVTEICKPNVSNYVYILDEPSKGLHYSDVKKIITTLRKIVNSGNTVIAIEHNLDVIMSSDYVLEFGPESGVNGGQIVYSGPTNKLSEKNTHTSQAIKGLKIKKDGITNSEISKKIEVQNTQYKFEIEKEKINVLKGPIGSGKSLLLRDLLYANPLKRYIASVSTQGKYYTRDIKAEKNQGNSLPLTRLISDDISVFGKNERVLETLNLTNIVEKLFYDYGEHEEDVYRSSFNFVKKAGKCAACSGNGRMMSYDFEKLCSDTQCEKALYDVLADRTRISRLSPLMKSEYKIDISKKYADMTEEEKRVFIFGDKKKTVYYAPKKKEYYWEGCNTILFTNMAYASKYLQEIIKPTYSLRTCTYCKGLGVNIDVSKSTYKGISYKDFNLLNIQDLLKALEKRSSSTNEERTLISVLSKLVSFGINDITLSDYTSELSLEKRMILQYVSYRMNPLSNTMIAWDDFGVINNSAVREKIIDDLLVAISKNTTVLLVDNKLKIDGMNEIFIGNNTDIIRYQSKKLNNIIYIEQNEALEYEYYESKMSSRDLIGNYLDIISMIRKEYKKKYKQYNFTGVKEKEKCDKCGGTGYYELNIGDLGINKCKCPDCGGNGFSNEINSCLIGEKNIGDILSLSLNELFTWCKKMGYSNISDIIGTYIGIGLFNISLNEKICELSSNEKKLFVIATLLRQDKKEIVIKDFSNTMSEVEYRYIIEKIDDIATDNKQKIVIIKEIKNGSLFTKSV